MAGAGHGGIPDAKTRSPSSQAPQSEAPGEPLLENPETDRFHKGSPGGVQDPLLPCSPPVTHFLVLEGQLNINLLQNLETTLSFSETDTG